jgi:hypothetical protein
MKYLVPSFRTEASVKIIWDCDVWSWACPTVEQINVCLPIRDRFIPVLAPGMSKATFAWSNPAFRK